MCSENAPSIPQPGGRVPADIGRGAVPLPPGGDTETGPRAPCPPRLHVCEVAHRTATGRPLALGEGEFDRGAVERHLSASRCPDCLRWYHSALRAYGEPPDDAAPDVLLGSDAGDPQRVVGLLPRARRLARERGGASGTAYEAEPREGRGLDSLRVSLVCRAAPADGRPGPAGWQFVLCATAANGAEAIGRYRGHIVTLELEDEGGEALVCQATLLPDAGGGLASDALPIGGLDPERLSAVTLLSSAPRAPV